jgi:hypothetical protein
MATRRAFSSSSASVSSASEAVASVAVAFGRRVPGTASADSEVSLSAGSETVRSPVRSASAGVSASSTPARVFRDCTAAAGDEDSVRSRARVDHQR